MRYLHAAQTPEVTPSNVMGAIAISLATVNVVGGFLVTDRMLKMFGTKK